MTDIEDIINRQSLDNIPDEQIKAFVLELVKLPFDTKKQFEKYTRQISSKFKMNRMPSKPGILYMYRHMAV